MRKRCTPYMVLFLLWSLVGQLNAQIYQVQIAAFTENIDQAFFSFSGYHDVHADKDYNNFVRYTLGEYFTAEEAVKARREAQSRGFSNVYVNTLNQPMYAYAGDAPHLPLMQVPEKENLYIRSVQFKEENLSVNKTLLRELEDALVILKTNPDLKLRIVGHTDDIGERVVNQMISKKRARIIQNFLLANEIPAYRLKMKVSEDPSPAVYFRDKGLPKTRDYNRRIIMTLVDLKDEIVVDNFKQSEEIPATLSAVQEVMQVVPFLKLV